MKQPRRARPGTRPWPRNLRLSPLGLLRRFIRLGGMGLTVAGSTFAPIAVAADPPFGSGAWFAQQPRLGTGRPNNDGAAPTLPTNAPPVAVNPQEALQRSSRAMANLSRTAAAITAAQAAQAAAHQLSVAQPNPQGVADGLTDPDGGGLSPHQNAAADRADPVACATYSCTWLNAQLPTQTVDGQGHHTVTVQQTGERAILNWSSFNVGRNTTLHFDQRAGTEADGTNDWIALNRISGAASPSQILGRIRAEGSVYLINPSGFLFGGSSTVDVHSLLATTLNPTLGGGLGADDFGSNYTYLNRGALANESFFLQPVAPLQYESTSSGPQLVNGQTPAPIEMGDIETEAGATLKSGADGYVMLAAPNVRNAGQIVADDGQVVLAAGSGMTVEAPDATSLAFSMDAGSRGVGDTSLPPGEVVNTGLIQARRGGVSIAASDVRLGSGEVEGVGTQHSAIVTTTSITRPGHVDIHADLFGAEGEDPGYVGVVAMAPGAVLALLPDTNGETTTSSAAADAAFQRGSIAVTAGSIRLMGDSLIAAPGQDVSLSAAVASTEASNAPPAAAADGSVAGRVFLDEGAAVDVAGIADLQLAMESNLVDIPRLGLNELADSPLQRDGFLYTSSITVDSRAHGTRENGTTWRGTPIANVNGYIDQVPRGVRQLLQDGGDITLTGLEVVAQQGSLLNLAGGYIHYLAGSIQTTRLLGINGGIVDIAAADPDRVYVGFAGLNEVEHTRSNVTEYHHNSPLAGNGFESAYVHGGNAGTLNIRLSGYYAGAYQPVGFTQILNGDIDAGALAGRHQVASGDLPRGGAFRIGRLGTGGLGGGSTIRNGALSYRVLDEVVQLPGTFDYTTALASPESSVPDPWNHRELPVYWSQVSGLQLASAGFSSISLVTSGVIRVEESGLAVQPGGTISLFGSIVTLAGNLTARSGAIDVTAIGRTAHDDSDTGPTIFLPAFDAPGAALPGNIEVAGGVTLSTRGLWVNDTGLLLDEMSGDAFIDGGDISLVTQASHAPQLVSDSRDQGEESPAVFGPERDLTGSVLLQDNSALDVSSGGYVQQDGALAMSNGVARGRGGSIELAVHSQPQVGAYTQTRLFTDIETGEVHAPSQGRLLLAGDLLAHGFSGGGELRLQALGFHISEQAPASLLPGTLHLLPDFFTGRGFSAYELAALYNVTVANGTIRPTQAIFDSHNPFNLSRLRLAPTGSDLYTLTSVGQLVGLDGRVDLYRQNRALRPTALALYSGGFLGWAQAPGGIEPAFADYAGLCAATVECITGTTLLGAGARIEGEHGAHITLGSQNKVSVLGGIVAHGGAITLTGDATQAGYAQVPVIFERDQGYASGSRSIWLADSALLDVSGVALIDRFASPLFVSGRFVQPLTGGVLDGGRVVLTNDAGYVLAQPGALIDVSGASDVFDLRAFGRIHPVAAQPVWSDAGSIVLGAGAGLYFNGSILAHGGLAVDGSAHGRGGSLTIAPESTSGGALLVASDGSTTPFDGATRIVVSQHGPQVPAGAGTPGIPVEDTATPSGELHLAADLIAGSGLDNLILGQDALRTPDGQASLPVEFAQDASADGNIDLATNRSIVLSASTIGVDDAAIGINVRLSAPYVSLNSYSTVNPQAPVARDSMQLVVNADAIDIGGRLALDDFSSAQFFSSGDLRFATPLLGVANFTGALLAGGDLDFLAERIYPATGNTFVVAALGGERETTITFGRPQGASDVQTPLSAGGGLLVDATHIVQGGSLFAPQGQIVLGVSDPADAATRSLFAANALGLTLAATDSVELAPGSLTSVSLGGRTVPFGATVDGTDLLYNRTGGSSAYLEAPPDKEVTFAGRNVALAQGATVDLSGGGQLQAQEFVPGTGGSRDVLNGSNVYAILPGESSLLAPFDPQLAGAPLVGRTVHLSGVPGLPAGDYVLLPGRYATLPGAFRVVQDSSGIDSIPERNVTLADGTHHVSGYFIDGLTGARDARTTAFFVQATEERVWQQYSEYALTDADAFFAEQAVRAATVVPQLARDAGRLVIAPTDTLSALDATVASGAAPGGAAAQIDIASSRIEITNAGATAAEGYVGIDAARLSGLDAGSLLIGGTRSRNDAGDFITPIATSVVLSNDADTLVAPEFVLVADAIALDSGSRMEAQGTAPAAAPITVGRGGALVRVSNAGPVTVDRSGDGDPGVLAIGEDVQLAAAGTRGAITLDSSGSTRLDPTASLAADAIAVNGGLITFLGSGEEASEGAAEGVVISEQTLSQLGSGSRLDLASRGTMAFVGDVTLAFGGELALGAAEFASDGGEISIQAPTLTIGNLLRDTAGAAEGSGATLQLSADELRFAGGSSAFSGFSNVLATATERVLTQATGMLDFGSAQTRIEAPVVLADSASDTTLRTGAALEVVGTAAAPDSLGPIGGNLALVGSTLDVDTRVQALAGSVDLRATEGDVEIGAGAQVSVRGARQTYFDVDKYASGGSIEIESLQGDVIAESGATLDFAAENGGGDAGRLRIAATEGQMQLDAALAGGSASGRGGAIDVDVARGLTDLDPLAATVASAGIDRQVSVRTREGDLVLAAALVGEAVSLTADGGVLRIAETGVIDASGARGGSIALHGQQGVELLGQLDAHATQAGQRGGDVLLGTTATSFSGHDAQHGYQLVSSEQSGRIEIGDTAIIDVSGADPANAKPGGRVHIRAPLLQDGGIDVGIAQAAQGSIIGARDVTLESYASWSTTDATTGVQHFDGVIDPAQNLFYSQTLLDFVRNPGFTFEPAFGGIENLHARPGIDLVNSDAAIDGGNIRVVSNWNLGAGSRLADGTLDLAYRYQGNAPMLSLRAAGDALFLASLSDGFFQNGNPFADGTGAIPPMADGANGISPAAGNGLPLPLLAMNLTSTDSTSYRVVAGGDVILDGHTGATITREGEPSQTRTMVAPTMIRTGAGSIDIVAGGDIELRDPVAPGVIYTAGRATEGTLPAANPTVVYSTGARPWLVDTGETHAIGAGDLSLAAGGSIVGRRGVVDGDGTRTGQVGTNVDQYWWPWMQGLCNTALGGVSGCTTDTAVQEYSLVNFANFGQGVLSAGGDVAIRAARSIRDLSVSLPTTYVLDDASTQGYAVLGGGNLDVAAGGDILGGDYFVSRGTGAIASGGRIGTSGSVVDPVSGLQVPTLLALQDGQLTVRARLGAQIGDLLNPSYLRDNFDLQPYSIRSALSLESLSGDVQLARASSSLYAYGTEGGFLRDTTVWPATVEATAFNGMLEVDLGRAALGVGLSASPQGQLSLIATDSVSIISAPAAVLGLFDVDPSRMASPAGGDARVLTLNAGVRARDDHEPLSLHAGDVVPMRIYSRDGDIVDTLVAIDNTYVVPNKPARIRAGRDIVNLTFIGQNLYGSDVTLIEAGRDLYLERGVQNVLARIELGGPGTLLISAGRDIGPLPPSNTLLADPGPNASTDVRSGFRTAGNRYNPHLSRGDGADLLIEYGVAPGVALQEFAQAYVAPHRSVTNVPEYTEELIAFVREILADDAARQGGAAPAAPTAQEAWSTFQQLSDDQQKRFVYAVLNDVLDNVGLDYNDPDRPDFGEYARGFTAIAALFPADRGYTANREDDVDIVGTGRFDMRDATMQTRQGGDISIVGPGGDLLIGSTAAPPTSIPSRQGILTLQQGSINIFSDQSTLLAQSRIFTQQGGDVVIWSSNGDINAGKGAKTTTELPVTVFLCDDDRFCLIDASGQVSGAGIATLQTIADGPTGSANLIAPRGTVDAGEAGIRVSGSLNVAALAVANADNIQVQGESAGVPTGLVNVSALGAASAAAAAANSAANDVARNQAPAAAAATMITVDVIGFGSMEDEEKRRRREAATQKESK